jgi:hypothetical protein
MLSHDILTLPIRSTSRSDGDPYNSNHMKESRGLKLSNTKRRSARKRERNKRGKTKLYMVPHEHNLLSVANTYPGKVN